VQITTSTSNEFHPAYSPDGTKIAFVSRRNGNDNIWVKNADGTGEAVQITTSSSNVYDYHPAFSPDGTRIAFSSERSGIWSIWVQNADGTGTAVYDLKTASWRWQYGQFFGISPSIHRFYNEF